MVLQGRGPGLWELAGSAGLGGSEQEGFRVWGRGGGRFLTWTLGHMAWRVWWPRGHMAHCITFFSRQVCALALPVSICTLPAGVYLFPNPRQRFALRIWPGTIQVSRSR